MGREICKCGKPKFRKTERCRACNYEYIKRRGEPPAELWLSLVRTESANLGVPARLVLSGDYCVRSVLARYRAMNKLLCAGYTSSGISRITGFDRTDVCRVPAKLPAVERRFANRVERLPEKIIIRKPTPWLVRPASEVRAA